MKVSGGGIALGFDLVGGRSFFRRRLRSSVACRRNRRKLSSHRLRQLLDSDLHAPQRDIRNLLAADALCDCDERLVHFERHGKAKRDADSLLFGKLTRRSFGCR
jgi:hypothetical protein